MIETVILLKTRLDNGQITQVIRDQVFGVHLLNLFGHHPILILSFPGKVSSTTDQSTSPASDLAFLVDIIRAFLSLA